MAKVTPVVKPLFLRGALDDDMSVDDIGHRLRSRLKNSISKYTQQRNELRERVVKETINSALPDMESFNIDQHLNEKPVVKVNKGWCATWCKLCGCMKVTIHEAIIHGCADQLGKTLFKLGIVDNKAVAISSIDDLNVLY